jgi:poly-gamma-glutamate synthesis protein (capsule biosynthesis protein)
VRLFLCGDVMTGRGIDQALPHPVNPVLYEPYVRNAHEYVHLAEKAHGPIPRPLTFDYIWGDALQELDRGGVDFRIVNLETAITTAETAWPDKGIHYRMHPQNVGCLSVAMRPAVLSTAGKGRVLFFSFGSITSGVFEDWKATSICPGVNLVDDLSQETAARVCDQMRAHQHTGDLIIASIHWGSNWGYEIPRQQIAFAHRLIEGGVSIVHGHSSHHVKAIEVFKGRLILYGCGDFLTDYEGISGYERFRGDLALMYLVDVDPHSGQLVSARLVPMRMRRFRLEPVPASDTKWLCNLLNERGVQFSTGARLEKDNSLMLEWRKE